MRVLGTAVLAFEWIVLGLAIPVAINVSGVPAGRVWLVFALASALTLAAIATMSRPIGVRLGWAVQVVAVAAGLVVLMLGILGLVFAALYFAAIRVGSRVDRMKAARADADPVEVG